MQTYRWRFVPIPFPFPSPCPPGPRPGLTFPPRDEGGGPKAPRVRFTGAKLELESTITARTIHYLTLEIYGLRDLRGYGRVVLLLMLKKCVVVCRDWLSTQAQQARELG